MAVGVPDPWIDLDDVKDALNKTSNADDAELDGFVAAACAMVEDIKGHVAPVTASDTYPARPTVSDSWPYGSRGVILLPEAPVMSVGSVVSVAGGSTLAVLPLNPSTGVDGWALRGSLLYVPTAGTYAVTYMVGRDPIPANFYKAAVELAVHLWRGSQLNQSTGRPQIVGDQSMTLPGLASALPYRVRELLGVYGDLVNIGQIG